MSFLADRASAGGNRILVPRLGWLRGTGGSGDVNELVTKTLTHITTLSAFITHVAKQGFRRKAHAHFLFLFFFLQDGIPRMVINGENPTVSNLFTKLSTPPKCQNILMKISF